MKRHQMSIAKRQQMKEEKDKKTEENCTFRPKINPKSSYFAQKVRTCGDNPGASLVERLHTEADRRESVRNRAKELIEEEKIMQCPFQPQISRSNKDFSRKSIDKRLGLVQKQRQEAKNKAKMKLDEEEREILTFKPALSSKSEMLAARSKSRERRGIPVEERLMQRGRQAADKRRQKEEDINRQNEFSKPQMSATSEALLEQFGGGETFLQRQVILQEKKERRKQLTRQQLEEDWTFKPALNPTSHMLAYADPMRMGETAEEKVERLAVKDTMKRTKWFEEQQAAIERQLTFNPTINPVSRVIAENRGDISTISTRLKTNVLFDYNKTNVRLMIEPKSQKDLELEECSFKPRTRTPNKYSHIKSNYTNPKNLMERIEQENKKKEDRIHAEKMKIEENELEKCTFHPIRSQSVSRQSLDTSVGGGAPRGVEGPRGVERYLELQDLAKRKKQEQKMREDKVFGSRENRRASLGLCTVPTPFKFMSNNERISNRTTQAELDAEKVEMGECRFHPETIESKNRRLIRQILEQDDYD
eukprot:GHVL01003070.1.p1 GENE.GHVL01003070.1~~GHVL01003070.1.p1  ORF type:complete len:533 (-),score=131.00 GHVL01003070.1:428-2026(-)